MLMIACAEISYPGGQRDTDLPQFEVDEELNKKVTPLHSGQHKSVYNGEVSSLLLRP